MNRRIVAAIAATAMLLTALLPGVVLGRSPSTATRPLPDSVRSMKLDKTVTQPDLKSKVHKDLVSAGGRQKVLVRLDATPAVDLAARGASAQVAQVRRIKAQQKSFMASVKRLDRKAIFLGQTQRATNIVALQIDASKIATLAKNPNVVSIVPVVNYTKALSETVPYIGATAVQAAGFKGNGVRVGIIDSGIDYTHVEFGGAGTAAAYEAAYGTSTDDSRNTTLDGLFPTSRVKGGFDFVGESWPLDDEIEDPDPDPIDFEGHGTHVADIVGGTHGVAPKVSLYALKVCSSVDTACSGVGLIRAMDWAIDPNGDGSTSDHLDVVNMSLGSDYGESFDDDLSLAIDSASKLGMLTVAAAGNGGNAPYIAGTPANAKSALSVAQTQVPSALARPLVVDAPDSIAGVYPNTETVTWAPITDGFSGDVTYVGRGCPAGSVDGQDEEDDYLANPSGKIALIDRGACSVSLKVDRAAKAGATAVLIGLVAPGDPISFSNGGGDTFVQTLIITQELSEAIKTELGNAVTVHVSVSNAVTIPLVGSMVKSSARGPSSPDNAIKPEIGAPGASVSAIAGSGTGMEGFGGTSGATPMITGSAALLRQAFPHRSIDVLKAMLVNNGETKIYNDAATNPGYLAPITRIGGGEVRVDRALKAKAAAWDKSTKLGLLSFELRDVTAKTTTITKTVEVHNFSSSTRTWAISSTFRYANDSANGAVKISTPGHITLHSGQTGSFKVTMTIKESKLRTWKLDSGPNALNADALDTQEYDGYIWLNDTSTSSDNNKKLHLAWQVLPRKSAKISATPRPVPIDGTVSGGDFDGGVFTGLPAGTLHLHNSGFGVGAVDTYSLVGTSPNLPTARRGTNTPIIDLKSVGVQTFPVPPDFCSDSGEASFVYVIAVSTWERHSTIGAVPGEYDVFFDTNRDGDPDFVVFNAAANGTADISELTFSLDLNDPDAEPQAFFYADNGTNDSNTLLTICGEQIGLDANNFGDLMDVSVGAFDNYFTGNLTDTIEGITVAPLGERYLGIFDGDGTVSGNVPANGSSTVKVVDFGAIGTNPSEIGLLLVNNAFRSGSGGDFHGGAPVGDDAIRVRVSP